VSHCQWSDVKEKFKKAFTAWFTGDDTGQLCMSDNAVITFSSKFTNESRSCVELALVISLPVTTIRVSRRCLGTALTVMGNCKI